MNRINHSTPTTWGIEGQKIDENFQKVSLEPGPGKIPIAGDDGYISPRWIRGSTNDIGVMGEAGACVGVCPGPLPAGMVALPGVADPASGSYGNYQYSDGSIMCWIPAFYYKYGDGTNGLDINDVEIKPFHYFESVAVANAYGYALHRAFYDEGEIKAGFFVDKYQCSNNSGTASSLKNGAPLSSAADHNPFSGLTGSPPNNYSGAIVAAKTRGASFFCASRFVHSALALLSYAHGRAATVDTWCAWYDAAGVNNFPKGCNNNALGDTNDTTVSYTGDGDLNCGLTGSGVPFAKTTHNGQACGVADLNGNMWEISIGLTCRAVGKTITAATQANPCQLTVTGHGALTGGIVEVTGVGGMTQLNNKVYTVTVIDADTVTLDGVDSTGFAAYTSGGSLVVGVFHVAKTTASMASLTPGTSLATDHWSTAGLEANFEPVLPELRTDYPNNGYTQRFGSGGNQVLSADLSGNGWTLTGLGLPRSGGSSSGGTNAYGADCLDQAARNDLCPLASGAWLSVGKAGVWTLNLTSVRGDSYSSAGFRAALYP